MCWRGVFIDASSSENASGTASFGALGLVPSMFFQKKTHPEAGPLQGFVY